MREVRGPNFYLDVIEGKNKNLEDMFCNEPEELRESMALNHAFDMLEEIGDIDVCEELVRYIDSEKDVYSYQKSGAITVIGSLGNKTHEQYVEQYLDSCDKNLAFAALCSMCQLMERNELSEKALEKMKFRLIRNLSELDCSVEEAVECARTLTVIGHKDIDYLLSHARSRFPEFWDSYQFSMR